MKLNSATSYAVQAVMHMARGPDKLYPSHEVARAEHIPERFLLKVLKPLVSAGLLHSLRGPTAVIAWPGRRARFPSWRSWKRWTGRSAGRRTWASRTARTR